MLLSTVTVEEVQRTNYYQLTGLPNPEISGFFNQTPALWPNLSSLRLFLQKLYMVSCQYAPSAQIIKKSDKDSNHRKHLLKDFIGSREYLETSMAVHGKLWVSSLHLPNVSSRPAFQGKIQVSQYL